MDNIELEDLVYTYPEYDDPSIQSLISAKEEFREIKATVSENVPKRGELYSHQKFLKRLMLQYDNQLVMWGAGLGKTCGYVAVTEHYKAIAGALEEIRRTSQSAPNTLLPPYKRVYILVKGQNLIDETKHQILCKCTDGDYITDQIINSKTEMARKANVTRSISKYYTITTYGTFAKTVFNMTDEQLHIEFDNSIFIVDEVHNINKPTKGFLRKNEFGNSYYAELKKVKRKKGEKKVKGEVKKEEKIVEARLIYDQLWRLFHLAKPRKVLLLSATPMINGAFEIADRLNLILPTNNQIPDTVDWKTVDLNYLEPYFRGLISYVRALDTGAIPQYQGQPIDAEYIFNGQKVRAEIAVYETEMAKKQEEVYKIAVSNPIELRPDSDRPEAFDDLKKQAANFIFPNNTTGSLGFKTYLIKSEKGIYTGNKEFNEWISTPEKFRSLSAKFFEIVRLCKEEPGNCWCYSQYIKGAGAIVLGLCFSQNGFENFVEASSVFSTSGFSGLSNVCGGKTLDDLDLIGKERFIRIPKRLRYALLTSDTSGPQASTLLELFNSYENRHGEYIKAIIGSPVTRDGLNLANVLQIHLVEAGWNQASSYQAESRAIRSTSHVDLIEEEKRKTGNEDATIFIRVYRHAAIIKGEETVDISHYELSEEKDREIKRIVRMMKIVATDCQINYARNVRRKDIDFSSTCDYEVCEYKCFDKNPKIVDYTSFDVLYSSGIVEAAKTDIIDIFRIVFQITYESLYKELEGYRRKFIDLAVTELVEKKIPIFNRYGYKSYLREDRGTLFLRNDFPLTLFEDGGLALTEYSSFLIGKQSMTLNEYNSSMQRGEGDLLQILEDIDEDEMDEKIDELTLENRILLLESVIQSYYIEKDENRKNIIILNKFKNYIHIEYDPKKSEEYIRRVIGERGKGRGRKPKEGSKFKLSEKQENELSEILKKDHQSKRGEVVYFHNLSTSGQSQTSYSMTAKFKKSEGKIRILKESENIGWRDANEVEDILYNEVIRNKAKVEKVDYDIYGLILSDNKLRIVDRTSEPEEQGSIDNRKISRGRVCNTWTHPTLIDLLWKLGYNPFNINVNFTRENLIEYLSDIPEADTFSDEKLDFYYKWKSSGASKSVICTMLQSYFEENGRLVRG